MKELVILLEEPSAKEMLTSLIPRIDSSIQFRCIPFQGKQDLEKNITRKLKLYQNKEASFLIIRDQDSADCHTVKDKLIKLCQASGRTSYKVRILCHELETVYLADLYAVEQGLNLHSLSKRQNESHFQNPDNFPNPKQKLKEITHNNYQDIAGSKSISPFLDISNTRSSSFKNLLDAIKQLSA